MRLPSVLCLVALPSFLPAASEPIEKHPEWDQGYSQKIREYTTAPEFLTSLVDHLPASDKVPTPERFLGYVAGTPDRLTYAEDVHRYMRALEAASPRVKVIAIGKSEEGREMILVAIADEDVLKDMEQFKEITKKLADPRKISDEEAAELTRKGKAIYYATGAMHSPETGSPEMLMELAYRLAVDETPAIQNIRKNVITLLTPVLEVDGRDRMVDTIRYRQANPSSPVPPLIYWGHYVSHDNNRDAIGLGLNLSNNVLKTFFEWHPHVVHDLHESIPFLYISTGTGPYNAWLDPIAIGEWERMASNEVQTLTGLGLPGVWTHGFYDGWAPNYMFWVAHGHNSIGRFYETFGNAVPSTEDRVVREPSQRAWFRPNPPLPKVKWSLRNNVNYQQSGLLTALTYAAGNREHLLDLQWQLGKRAIAKAATEGPAAYVLDSAQKRRGQLRDLLTLLRAQGIEVHQAEKEFTIDPKWPPKKPESEADKKEEEAKTDKEKKPEKEEPPPKFAAGSYIIRTDQPYSRLADALLDTQYVRGDERVYDDTGWTLGLTKNLDVKRIVNTDVLKVPMHLWDGSMPAVGGAMKSAAAVALPNDADTDLIRLRTALPDVRMAVAEAEIKQGKTTWPAGTILLAVEDANRSRIEQALVATSLRYTPLKAFPTVRTHDLVLPRIAIMHTWFDTQDEGWYRLALDTLHVPYDYISTQDATVETKLRSKYDVIIFPPAGADPQDIVNGMPAGAPIPWKKTELTPNMGVDETDDMRPGLGLTGLQNVKRFVEEGGLLVTMRDTAEWAVTYGLARWITVAESETLHAAGSILRADVIDKKSPVAAGYDEFVPVHFAGGP
ncbi:MAG: hypothetical protein HYX75_19040, partial [Acidobacteria bacterium]|nr:hypothetical protein [Acidobacteriota bacterium]